VSADAGVKRHIQFVSASPIITANTPEQLADSVSAVEMLLTPEAIGMLDEASASASHS
jgi:aryl-alcohol dehydrogenase-like predicted oxidoreductase